MSESQRRRALVTGASGYVGGHLARRLAAQGWEVHVLLRPGSDAAMLGAPGAGFTVHRFGGETDDLVRILREAAPDAVFHLAASFVAEHQPADVVPLVQANLLFATQLAEAMRASGTRTLLNTGSAWQHFGNREYDPVNLYAATKQAFEAILAYYVNAHELRVATLVLADTYGPRDPRPKLLNALWRASATGTPLAMATGEEMLDLVHVDDVAAAFLAAEVALRGAAPGHVRYGVSSGQPLRLREVVAAFEQASGRPLDVRWGARPSRARDILVPWTDFTAPPGWTPRITLVDGIRQCAHGGLPAL